jgi:hypothetical protein
MPKASKLLLAITAAIALLVPVGSSSMDSSAEAAIKTYKSCSELQKKYKFGLASSNSPKNKGAGPIEKPAANRALYLKHSKLDKDKDGIACEVIKKKVTANNPVSGSVPGLLPSPSLAPLLAQQSIWSTTQLFQRSH